MVTIIPTCRYYEQSYDEETDNGRTHFQSTAPCGCYIQCWGRESLIFLKFQKYLRILIKSPVFFLGFSMFDKPEAGVADVEVALLAEVLDLLGKYLKST